MPLPQSMFLLTETRDQPMHVGSLQLFRPPEGAGPEFLREMYENLLSQTEMASLFRKRPHRSATTLWQWAWEEDKLIDLEHHVRHSALPRPGRIRELLALVSRLHATLLDRSRPLWEAHLIEGLNDGRYAVYTKVHHALMDGVSAAKLLERSLTDDPDRRDLPPPWAPRPRRSRKGDGGGGGLLALPKTAFDYASDFVGLGPAVLKRAADQALHQQMAALPFQAPRTMFNVSITGSRRFAAQSWSIESFKAVAKASESTLNDVLLAVCSGALRRYLIERDALPGTPLVAMTPVSLRADDDDADEGGVNVGTILCNLGTHLEDPVERLTTVRESMNAGKAAFKGLSQLQVTALSAGVMLPLGTQMFVDPGYTRPPYNLVISNVPGPTRPLYFNGARLEGSYPLSIPHHGQAMNITVTSYNGNLEFGIVGCRRTVPSLQHLLGYLDESLQELTQATGA